MTNKLTGGCQCGAVRFCVTGDAGASSVCHCRMCQKASSAPFLALVGPSENPVEWTRGAPKWFKSSNAVRRGFCGDCGTPLAYDAPDGLVLCVIAFDNPDAVPPVIAYGVEGKSAWCDEVANLPRRDTLDDLEAAPFLASLISHQHPDNDTQEWPLAVNPTNLIDHIGIGVSDFPRAQKFYDAALGPLGISLLMMVPQEHTSGANVGGYGKERPVFWLHDGGAQTPTLHIAFHAETRADVDAFYKAAIKAGGADNGAPGLRSHYHPDYYGAFVRDADGNNIEAVCHAKSTET